MFAVETSEHFDEEIIEVLDFLALESPYRALHFYDELMENLHHISIHPTLYPRREGMEFHTRELILQGYTVPFFIDESVKKIIVLGIFGHRFWKAGNAHSDTLRHSKWGHTSPQNLPGPLSTSGHP